MENNCTKNDNSIQSTIKTTHKKTPSNNLQNKKGNTFNMRGSRSKAQQCGGECTLLYKEECK